MADRSDWGAGVWNLLHDGSIAALEGTVPGDVTLTVAIAYLRAMLPDPGHSFHVHLQGCSLLECRDFVDDEVRLLPDLASVAHAEPDILSAAEHGATIVLSLTYGSRTYMELHLQYDRITVSVESGRVVPFDELVSAAERYWEGLGQTR